MLCSWPGDACGRQALPHTNRYHLISDQHPFTTPSHRGLQCTRGLSGTCRGAFSVSYLQAELISFTHPTQMAACPTPAFLGPSAAASQTAPGPVAPARWASWATAPTVRTWMRWVSPPGWRGPWRLGRWLTAACPHSVLWSQTFASPQARPLAASTPTPGSTACHAHLATKAASPMALASRRPRRKSK